MRRAVITGIGVVSPAGNSPEELFDRLSSGEGFTGVINRFDASRYPSRHAGLVLISAGKRYFPRGSLRSWTGSRTWRSRPPTGHLKTAGLTWTPRTKTGSGSAFGNALGGWAFAEEELRDLWTSRPSGSQPVPGDRMVPGGAAGPDIHFLRYKRFFQDHNLRHRQLASRYRLRRARHSNGQGGRDVRWRH